MNKVFDPPIRLRTLRAIVRKQKAPNDCPLNPLTLPATCDKLMVQPTTTTTNDPRNTHPTFRIDPKFNHGELK